MMYNQKLVTCLKSNGKILREFKDTVYVPFGSEYSILVKNLNSVRAIVHIEIDGKQVCEEGLVIDANKELEVERFITDLNKGNKFKFIERTGSVEQHRGVKMDDGLIRVSFQFEKVMNPIMWVAPAGHWEWKPNYYTTPTYAPPYNHPGWWTKVGTTTGSVYGNTTGTFADKVGTYTSNAENTTLGGNYDPNVANATDNLVNVCRDAIAKGTISAQGISGTSSLSASNAVGSTQAFVNNVGITVPGAVSNQKFTTVSSFPTESEKHVMVLRILGETEGGHFVKAPVTVKAKPKCETCGRTNKATAHFCINCGTALEIIK